MPLTNAPQGPRPTFSAAAARSPSHRVITVGSRVIRSSREVRDVRRQDEDRYRDYVTARMDGLRRWDVAGPVTALADHTEAIRASLTTTPVRTVAEACDRSISG